MDLKEKVKKRDEFLKWVSDNRNNPDVSDEDYLDLIDFHLSYYRPDIHASNVPGVSQTQMDEIKQHWKEKNKLAAVKAFKEYSGFGLKDAKDWCEENLGPLNGSGLS